MPDRLRGVFVWIWNLASCLDGNYDAIAERIKSVGAAGVIVKSCDGGRWYPQYQTGRPGVVPIAEIVSELQARGISVGTWSYLYLSDPGANFARSPRASGPARSLHAPAARSIGAYRVAGYQEEAKRDIETITMAHPDFHIADVEAEAESQSDPARRATSYTTTVKSAVPGDFLLGYAPLPAINYHLELPYYQFTDAGFVMLPQTYWRLFGWTPTRTVEDEFYTPAADYNLLTQPVAPAYIDAVGYAPTDVEMNEFASLLKAHDCTSTSVWSFDGLTDAGWQRVARLAQSFQVQTPQPKPQPTNDDFIQVERYLLSTPPDIGSAISYLQRFV